MHRGPKYDDSEAKARIEAFCAYQERCEYEVRKKLDTWHIPKSRQDQFIDHLIDYKFIDEERFAEAFVLGKFRIKRWGRYKIRQKLKEKRIGSKLIEQSLNKINEDEYFETIKDLVDSKYRLLGGERDWDNKVKVKRFLASRGFELDLINKALD